MAIRILGIDPGTHIMGFGLIEVDRDEIRHLHAGAVHLKKATLPERLLELADFLKQLLSEAKPQALSLEKIFLGKNVDSAFKLGHARGVIMAEALRADCMVFEYANRAVKKSLTGNGGSDKEQVAQALMMLLQLKTLPKPIDASDALAMAYFHALELRQQNILRKGVEI